LAIHEVEEAARIVQEAAHDDANIIFGAVIDPHMTDEVRMTVIATGFAEKRETVGIGGKVVDLPRPSRSSAAGVGGWRRRPGELRAESDDRLAEGDLDVPAFLRRQADCRRRAAGARPLVRNDTPRGPPPAGSPAAGVSHVRLAHGPRTPERDHDASLPGRRVVRRADLCRQPGLALQRRRDPDAEGGWPRPHPR